MFQVAQEPMIYTSPVPRPTDRHRQVPLQVPARVPGPQIVVMARKVPCGSPAPNFRSRQGDFGILLLEGGRQDSQETQTIRRKQLGI